MKKLPGFTLTEIVVVVALMAIVSTVIVEIIISTSSVFADVNDRQEQSSDIMRTVLDEMYQTTRQATSFLDTYTLDEVTYTANPNNPTAFSSSLIILTPLITDAKGTLGTDATKTDTIIFTRDADGTVRKIVVPHAESFRASANQVMMEGVTTLSFLQYRAIETGNRVVRVIIIRDGQYYSQDMVGRND